MITLSCNVVITEFIAVRQMSSPFTGAAACTKWTSGMPFVLVGDFNTTPGVQMAVGRLDTPPPRLGPEDLTPEGRANRRLLESFTFSEAIVTGPPHVLEPLADGRTPGACSQLSRYNGPPGRVEPLPTPKVGDQTWSYRILDSTGYVWHWVQVVRHRDHLIEIRIPNQEPGPRGDMVSILHQAAQQAYARAARTLT